jgi:16S rRNA (cytosine1402-N4)-methyltransferase
MGDLYHKPVMLSECIEALNIQPEGVYVDVTFGGGGHSRAILEKLRGGKLVAFDQDEDARQQAELIQHRSFLFCQANFMHLKRYLKLHGIAQVDGILADLGISSHQIDSPARGFSTRFDGPLDMRMDKRGTLTAANILNDYPEEKLHRIFGMYGEVKNARTLARTICQQRASATMESSAQLVALLKPLAPRGKEFKYYAQVYQALRMEVNNELGALEQFLMQSSEVMKTGGRLVVMSYHSLEDRMVKNFMNTGKVFGELEKDFFGNPLRPFQALTRKPIEAGPSEIENNSRARSAKLRIAEKL